MASLLLEHLKTKSQIDAAIRDTKDKLVVLRFGRDADANCLPLDEVVSD